MSFGAVAIGAGLNLALAVAVGREYGPADTGVFFAAIGIFLVIGNGLKLGADTGVVRGLSREIALDRPGDVRAIAFVALVPVAVIAVGASAVLWFLAPQLVSEPEGAALLRALAPCLAPFALLSVLTAATRGLGGVGPYAVIQNVLLPLTRLAGVFAAAATGAGILGATWAWAMGLPILMLAAAGVFAAQTYRLPGSWRVLGSARMLVRVAREFWSFALPRAGAALVEIALEWLDVLLVAMLAGPREAGLYAIATRLVKLPLLVEHAMRITVAPEVSAALARGHRDAVQALADGVTRVLMMGVWPYLVVLVVFRDSAMRVFGSGFDTGAPLLAVLAVAMAVRAAAGPVQSILLLGGHSGIQLVNKMIALAVCVGGNLLLTPRWGALGAAGVWVAVNVVDTALAAWHVRFRMGVPLGGAALRAVGPVALLGSAVVAVLVRGVAGTSSAALVLAGGLSVAVVVAVSGRAGLMPWPEAWTGVKGNRSWKGRR